MFIRNTAIAIAFSLLATPLMAKEAVIEMRNKSGAEKFAYVPDLLRLDVGDTVVFNPVDKGHNVVSIPGLTPEGATPLKIGFNKQETVTFDVPGIYGIKCTPHVGLGMAGIIVVGDGYDGDAVKDAISKLPSKARQRIESQLDDRSQAL